MTPDPNHDPGGVAGTYGLGSDFDLFPSDRIAHASQYFAHEHAHTLLGVATTTGALHQTIKYLAFRSSHTEHWTAVLHEAAQMSKLTHEAVATYAQLDESGPITADAVRALPPDYQRWVRGVTNLVAPIEAPVVVRRHIVAVVGRLAFDDPLHAVLEASSDDLLAVGHHEWLPQTDARFRHLIDAGRDQIELLQAAASAAAELVGDDRRDGESVREFLIRRRRQSYALTLQLEQRLAQLVPDLDVTPPGSDALRSTWAAVEAHLRRELPGPGGDGLHGWTIDFSDDDRLDEPDPQLFRMEIAHPNAPLSGLLRVQDPLSIEPAPSLTHITHVQDDSQLSNTLIARSGDFYARYYWLRDGRRQPVVGYALAPTLDAVLPHKSSPLIIDDPVIDPEAPPEVYDLRPAGFWLRQLNLVILDRLVDPDRYSLALLGWPTDGVLTACFTHRETPRTVLVNITGAALSLLIDDAQRAHMTAVDQTWGQPIVHGLAATFPYCLPSQGRPL